jgi:hypothetical protein
VSILENGNVHGQAISMLRFKGLAPFVVNEEFLIGMLPATMGTGEFIRVSPTIPYNPRVVFYRHPLKKLPKEP